MPFYHKVRKFTPLAVVAERNAVKNGVHKAIFTPRGDKYVGDWKRDLKNGKGVFLTINGKLYEGDWFKGYRHGFGTLSYRLPNGTFKLKYRGDWVQDKPHGMGWKYYDNGDVYYGFWKKGLRHGYGKMWYCDGTVYVGYWNDNQKQGLGMFVQDNNNRYEGHWLKNTKHGLGRFFHVHTGQMQEGCWQNNVCVQSKVTDIELRQYADRPTKYPIPCVKLANAKLVLEENNLWQNQLVLEFDKKLNSCIEKM